MSAPTLDKQPGSTQDGSSSRRPRRRRQLALIATALLVLAVAFGASLAIATRPSAPQAPAVAADQNAAGDQGATDQGATTDQDRNATPEQPKPADPGTDKGTSGGDTPAAVLPDGNTDAYITKVDAANDRITVDVVQVFHDNAAVKEAIADGRSPSEAKFLTTWVRNVNPRLRTLPLAGDLVVNLRDACGESSGSRDAVLTTLAANASQDGTYYYTLTVADGQVQRIQEKLAVNAC
jgi:hypothetical protein